MATRVEVGSIASLPVVPVLSDISQGDTLKRTTCFRQAGDTPRASSLRVLDGQNPLRSPARLFPLPGLAPKPFSKEQAPDVKASGPSLRPSPTGLSPAGVSEKVVARVPNQRMPILAGQEADAGDSRGQSPSAFSQAAFLRPSPSPEAICETSRAGPTLGKGLSLRTQEAGMGVSQELASSTRPEVAVKPALPARKPVGTLPQPASLPQDIRPAPSPAEAGPAQPLTKASSLDTAGPSPEPKPRPRRRPVSAIFTESPQPALSGPGGVAVLGKVPPAPPEKTWVRKPRPLSVDLTARFESPEALLRKVADGGKGGQLCGLDGANPEPRGDKGSSIQADLDTDLERAKKVQQWREKMLFKQAEPGDPKAPTGSAQVSAGGDQNPSGKQAGLGQEPEKMPESPSPRLGRGLEAAGVKNRGTEGDSTGMEWTSRGSVKKRLSLFQEITVASAGAPERPPTTPKSSGAMPQPERAGLSVQERIKGWAAESAEGKLEIRRRTLQARPLSADVTKLLSPSVSSSEPRHQQCPVPGGQSTQEPRGKPKVEHGLDRTLTPRSPWKPGAADRKCRQAEPKDGDDRSPGGCWGGGSAGSPGPSEASLEDSGRFQMVWATLFEHHVEKCTVAGPTGHDLPAMSSGDGVDAPVPAPRTRPEKGPGLGKDPLGMTHPSGESCKWPQSPEPGKLGHAAHPDSEPIRYHTPAPETHTLGNKHSQKPFLQHTENRPMSRRVEPRYDIMHTVGERAHSEAVTTAPGGQAVTLRRDRSCSLRGRQLSQEGDLECDQEGHVRSVHRASLIWEARDLEAGGPRLDVPKPKDVFGGSYSPWTRETVNWRQVTTLVSSVEPSPPEAPSARAGKAAVWETQHLRPDVGESGPRGHVSAAHRGLPGGCPLDPPARAEVESPGSRARAHTELFPGQKGPLVDSSDGVTRLESEVRMRKASPTEPRMDRWRRRTLPHDTKFDAFCFLATEHSSKGEQRRTDSLSPTTSALQKPPLTHNHVGTQAGPPGSPQDWTSPTAKPGPSAQEPRAVFFAVTYQIPDIQKARNAVKSGPEDPLEQSRRIASPPSSRSFAAALNSPCCEEPQTSVGSKDWTRGREGEKLVSASKHQKPGECPLSMGGAAVGPSSEGSVHEDALWIHWDSEDGGGFQNDRKDGASRISPSSGPRSSVALSSHTKASSLLVRRRTTVVSETFPGKMKDSYRSSVLDIDALMAEYREQSTRVPSKAWEWRDILPTEPSGSLQGRPSWSDRAEEGRRSPREAPGAQRLGKQASCAKRACSPTPGSSKPPAETLGTTTAPKSSSPLWGLPHSLPEKYAVAASTPAGPRKEAMGVAEDESRAFARHHRAKGQNYPAEAETSGWEGPGSGVTVAPRSPPADRKKGTPRKSTWRGEEDSVAQWGDPLRDCRKSSLDIKRVSSEKGSPARVREGLCVLQEARERRQAQPEGRPSLSAESAEAGMGPCQREPRTRDSPKVPSCDLELGDALQDDVQLPRRVVPVATGSRRSHSFCKDKRSGPFVDQLKQCFSRRPAETKDTDTLVQEADGQYGTWAEQRQGVDSLAAESPSPDSSAASAQKQPPSSRLSSLSSQTEPTSAGDQRSTSADRSSSELDSTDGAEGPPQPDSSPAQAVDDFSFIHQTSVLDSSALKTRVQLSKRSRRRGPTSHSLRHNRRRGSQTGSRAPPGGEEEEAAVSAWMFKDSTEEKSPRREESDEEETPRTSASHPQRMPVFPGVGPAVLKAQLHKRPEFDGPGETPGTASQPKTPKSPFQPGMLGGRVLPSSMEKEERSEEPSPQWLRELRSKKRQSLHENQA